MLFALDIDGTIAGGFPYAAYYNETLELQIPADELMTITSYHELYTRPEMRAVIRQDRSRYERAFAEVTQHLPSMQALVPLPHAVEKVNLLATYGTVKYYTIRKSRDEHVQEQMKCITQDWLTRYGFPNAASVFFPKSFTQKLAYVAQERDERILFIDDRWQDVVTACETLTARLPESKGLARLKERLMLCAFGIDALPHITADVPLVALPSWSLLEETLLPLIPHATTTGKDHR